MTDTGNLLRFNDHSLPENFVSMAVLINEKTYKPYHAAILIRYKKINYLHHFPGLTPPVVIENFNESGWYIYKIIKSFNQDDPSEIGSVLQHCKRICSQSNITYGYIADGSFYNEIGNFVSRVGLPEFGTCVGFCLNTLANLFIDADESIIELDDWDDSGISELFDRQSQERANSKYPNLDWNLYKAFKKRITPVEYLCISYFSKFPVKKADISRIENSVQEEIKKIYSAN